MRIALYKLYRTCRVSFSTVVTVDELEIKQVDGVDGEALFSL